MISAEELMTRLSNCVEEHGTLLVVARTEMYAIGCSLLFVVIFVFSTTMSYKMISNVVIMMTGRNVKLTEEYVTSKTELLKSHNDSMLKKFHRFFDSFLCIEMYSLNNDSQSFTLFFSS
jgi:hypothetical protein